MDVPEPVDRPAGRRGVHPDDYSELDRLVLPSLPPDWVTAPGVDDPFAGPDDRFPRGGYPDPESYLPGAV